MNHTLAQSNDTKVIASAGAVLGDAFSEDPLFQVVLSQNRVADSRAQLLSKVFARSCDYGLRYGTVLLNPSRTASAILLPKSDIFLKFSRILVTGLYKTLFYIGPVSVIKLELHEQQMLKEINRLVQGINAEYIWSLGTFRTSKGSGMGREIMQACDRHAIAKNLDALVLKTENPDNVRFYEKFGYEVVYDTTTKFTKLRSWIMIKRFARTIAAN